MGPAHLCFSCVVAICALVQSDGPPTTRPAAQTPPALSAHVDPRVELMSIVFRLAGSSEYNMDNSESPYADDVEKSGSASSDSIQSFEKHGTCGGITASATMR
ncbi:MAG TPA: hypothetical protein VMV94_04525 [Phycisphaerae bacterium]|nr:hypothetical protein [Phycisphaerae bacterium]